jgi:hypothetical protein
VPDIQLTAEEVTQLKEIANQLSSEDIKYFIDFVEDRKAISRIWAKAKNMLLVTAAVVVAYFTIIDKIKDHLTQWLSGGHG